MDLNYDSTKLIFIVGCPRSGTTWVQRLLACHPQISTGQESDLFDIYIGPQLRAWHKYVNPKSSSRGGVGLACYFREKEFLGILREYMLRLIEPMIGNLRPDELFLEKTPSHALFIPEIMELLPRSRIIHVLRDPRDVTASLLAASKSWGTSWAPRNARAAVIMWLHHVQAVKTAAHGLPLNQFYEVRYEELHEKTLEVLRNLSDFLGLRWKAEDIRNAVAENSAEIAKKSGGTIIPVGGQFSGILGGNVKEPEGFIRNALPRGWKKDLSWAKKFWVWYLARNTMREYGYYWPFP
ncbi:sulfotransferase [bacterium]|nr:sulfotransferase [bacterium]